MPTVDIPHHTSVLVIGGGPSGSYSATLLAREGIDTVLLESSQFPRYHIGESMLPSVLYFLQFVDAEKKFRDHGFTIKPGAAFKFNQFKKEGYTNFGVNTSWNVIRSEFDHLLLQHSRESGAKVFEETKVTEIEFSAEESDRPVAATYVNNGKIGKITFDYLVDASGRNGIMSTKYLKNRQMNSTLQNLAVWGYWKDGKPYMPGTERENAVWSESLTDESGWAWYIPLHNGTVSVGVVMNQTLSNKKKAEGRVGRDDYSLRQHYLDQLEFLPGVKNLLEFATLRDDGYTPVVQSASDYSYSATNYAGNHYRLAGDASAFIDPYFSSGVHLAFNSGLTAAASIAASMKQEVTEQQAVRFHDIKVGISYTRFLIIVMGAYKQIRAQSEHVLSDVNEDNFDRAFDLIRPVIQGTADVNKKLSEDEVHKAMDFMTHVINNLIDAGDVVDTKGLPAHSNDTIPGSTSHDEQHILERISDGPIQITEEGVDGMYLVAKRGSLGIVYRKD